MKFTGKLKQPIIDFMTHRLTILFEPNEDFGQAYEELKDCDKLVWRSSRIGGKGVWMPMRITGRFSRS